jgi:hypothetical protein
MALKKVRQAMIDAGRSRKLIETQFMASPESGRTSEAMSFSPAAPGPHN